MSAESTAGHNVFILRFWKADTESDEWSGCVDHVATAERRFFSKLDEADEFIKLRLSERRGHDARA